METILVVDDEADIRELVQEILTEEGYQVGVAGNAAEARAACAAQLPDLVLLDIWMPDTDGISLLREWQNTFGASLPVVMMSGHGTVETAVEATRLGASLTRLLDDDPTKPKPRREIKARVVRIDQPPAAPAPRRRTPSRACRGRGRSKEPRSRGSRPR